MEIEDNKIVPIEDIEKLAEHITNEEDINLLESNTESKRQLATIQQIESINPIPDADQIEVVKLVGLAWHIVVKKDEFKVGDYCIYCEIDSIMPEADWTEFLRPVNFRIRTRKMRGQISQGICFPLSILLNRFGAFSYYKDYVKLDYSNKVKIEIGLDVTELLGVKKYEPKTFSDGGFLSGKMKAGFPSFLMKTDETRVQGLQGILDENKGVLIYITEKLDGTSVTYYMNNGVFGVCSRNREVLDDDTNVYWKMARKYNIEEMLKQFDGNIAIQGEIVGPKIQKNKYKLEDQRLYIFDIFDIDRYEYFDYENFRMCCDAINEDGIIVLKALPIVPVIEPEASLTNDVDELVKYATRKSFLNKDVWAEGIVIRGTQTIRSYNIERKIHSNRLSFKVINPQFLLKYDE